MFCPCFGKATHPETPDDRPMHMAQAAEDNYQILTFVAKARYLLYKRVIVYQLC